MAHEHILFDKTELVLIVLTKNNARVVNVPYDKVINITIEKYTERFLFRAYESERISIKTRFSPDPYIYKKKNEKQFFESYKENLIKFAKDNKLSLTVNL